MDGLVGNPELDGDLHVVQPARVELADAVDHAGTHGDTGLDMDRRGLFGSIPTGGVATWTASGLNLGGNPLVTATHTTNKLTFLIPNYRAALRTAVGETGCLPGNPYVTATVASVDGSGCISDSTVRNYGAHNTHPING